MTFPAGTSVGCSTCHVTHDTSLAWVDGTHGAQYLANRAGCAMCHGADLTGTPSSATAADRSYVVGGKTYAVAKGTEVSCSTCHLTHDTTVAWVDGTHGAKYTQDPAACAMCHGSDLAGTSITIAAAARSYTVGGTTYTIAAGTQVGCATCHVAHATDTTWVAPRSRGRVRRRSGGLRHVPRPGPRGTAISKAAANRSYTVSGKTYLLASGVKVGCATCHVPHATTSAFASTGHGAAYENDPAACTSCHGATLAGTVLSKAAAARSYAVGKKTVAFAAGEQVACAKCHVMHATDSTFAGGHESAYKNDKASCRMCHGSTLSGTSLSVTSAERTVRIDGRNYTIPANTKVGCDRCHEKP